MAILTSEVADRALLDTIYRMACLGEARKTNVKSHIERIRGYCFVLARSLGLPMQDVEIISYASQLHDIGEIVIPPEVYLKTGELTSAEWEMIQRHPIVGADMLRGSPSIILQAAEIIALTHHERWNGAGYPRGLKGEQIPLSGRICGLADIFDALTTKRNYKSEVTIDEAHDLIVESQGEMFDALLITAFQNSFNELVKVRQNSLA